MARELKMEMKEAGENDFQYIVTLNSDQVPREDFSVYIMSPFEHRIKVKAMDAIDKGYCQG